MTTPKMSKLGFCQGCSSPLTQGASLCFLGFYLGLVALTGFGLFGFNESLVVKYPQQRADHKNQPEGYLP